MDGCGGASIHDPQRTNRKTCLVERYMTSGGTATKIGKNGWQRGGSTLGGNGRGAEQVFKFLAIAIS